MPDPTTLKALWEQELSGATDTLNATRAELNDALALEAEVREERTRSLRAGRARREGIEALWRRAGAADTPSEGAAIMEEIQDEMAALQDDEARSVGMEWERVKAKAQVRRLTRAVKRCAAERRATSEALAEAEAEHEERSRWAAAAGSAPLDAVSTEAGNYLDSTAYDDLETSVHDALPELLRRAAAARVELERTRLSYARRLADFTLDEIQELWQDSGGPGDLADRALLTLDRHAGALEHWFSSASRRLERAVSTLDGLDLDIASSEAAAVAVVPGGAAAAVVAEEEALAAQADVEMRRFQLLRSLTQRQVEPTGARKAAVTMAENRLADAQAIRDTKVAALDPLKAVIDEWQAQLSDESWGSYLAFLEATATLHALESTDPAALVTDVADAEADAAAALSLALAAERGVEQWEEFIEEMHAREEGASADHRRRLLQAVRGDSFIPGLPPVLP